MTNRPDLSLTPSELATFLDETLGDGAIVPFAVAGPDGYPAVGLVRARRSADAGALSLAGDRPADGAVVCVIVERGATYDDITAAVARGVVRNALLPLDDLVTFAFDKLARPT
jgi:hypothetical protein